MKNSTKEDETNSLTQNLNILPLPHDNMQFKINVMGNMSDINFYVSDENGADTTGIAFCVAYRSAKYRSNNIKELCTYVGSMLCAVVPGFRNSMEKSLYDIGVRPCFVSLPSQANEKNIVLSDVPRLDWSSILVVFGYCIVLLFKPNAAVVYNNYISNWIRELQAKVRWDPSNKLDIPFDATQANLVRTMFDSPELRSTVVAFLVNHSKHPDSQTRNVCQYLSINLISLV
jgi:hypothetical protein